MGTIANMDVRLGLDDSGFAAGIARAQGQAQAFGQKMGSIGTAMSLAVTAPLAGIGVMAVKSAAGFEQSMNVMAQVTGATGEQMAQMQAQALQLGAVTSFSAGEAAEAMLELGKAGLSPVEIMGAIGGTMDMAAAGNMGLAQSATIAANAMNAFQLPAENVTDIANMLAAAANASSADINDLAAGMQMAGAVFASNGQSVQDLAAGMAILANNGIAGSDAGTSLKTMLMRLTAPTGEAADAINSLGIQVYNADGSMRDFGAIIGSLEQATAGMTDQQRNMALTTIFGADAIRAATILAGEGADGFNDMAKAVGKQGAASATANARMKGMAGAVEYLKGSIDSFLINTALPWLDTMSGLVRGAADLLSMIGELPAPVRNMALGFAAVAAAAGPVLLIASKLVPVFGAVGAALGVLASPVGLVIAAVAALGVAWATNFGGIQSTVAQALTTLRPGFAQLQKWLDMAMTGDFSGLQTEIGDALNSVQVAVANFKWSDFITGLTDWGTYVADLAWTGIVTALTDWGTYVADLDWDGYIAVLSSWGAYITDTIDDWGTYVTALDWGGYITAALDWGTYITATLSDWGTYVGALVWGDYITPLWADYIKPLVWDAWLVKIDWTAIGLTAVDWAMWIPALAWTAFISPVRWVSWIASLVWNSIIDPLFWSDFLPKLANWSDYLAKLDWNTVFNPVAWGVYVSTLDWGKYLPAKFAWSKFVEKVDWLNHIPGLSWPTFNAPDWSNFVAALKWPVISAPSWSEFIESLEWPKIPDVDWGEFIPDLAWPDVPSFPGWADILRALGWGGPPSTSTSSGATTPPVPTSSGVDMPLPTNGGYPVDVTAPPPQVSEQDLLGGSAMGAAGAAALIGPVYVTNEIDLAALAYQVAQLLKRRT